VWIWRRALAGPGWNAVWRHETRARDGEMKIVIIGEASVFQRNAGGIPLRLSARQEAELGAQQGCSWQRGDLGVRQGWLEARILEQ